MRMVANPAMYPQRCGFLGTISGFAPGGFIEGDDLDPRGGGVRAYMSMAAFNQIAAQLGYAPTGGRDVQAATAARLEQELAKRDERIAQLEQVVASMDVAGITPRRKPGRPKAAA